MVRVSFAGISGARRGAAAVRRSSYPVAMEEEVTQFTGVVGREPGWDGAEVQEAGFRAISG